jgi:predicted dehydrogenase
LITVESEKASPVVQKYPTVQPATYLEYYRIFASALRGEGEVPVKAEEARDVLRIIEMAEQSSEEGRTIEV